MSATKTSTSGKSQLRRTLADVPIHAVDDDTGKTIGQYDQYSPWLYGETILM